MIPFNRDWLFFKGDISAPAERGFTKAGAWWQNGAAIAFDDSKWQKVHLPHDFMFTSGFSKAPVDQTRPDDLPDMGTIDSIHSSRGSISGGVAWYRKHFYTPENTKGKKVYLRFDGVCRDATVYVNQYRVLSHLNGFMGFVADVSDLLTYEGENVLAVCVDTTETEGWWYQGGGIYRNVWLDVRERVHFNRDTLHILPTVDHKSRSASVKVGFDIENHTEKSVDSSVLVRTYSPSGELVNESTSTLYVPSMDRARGELEFNLHNLELWNCDTPNLYRVVLTTDSDQIESNIGFRHIAFDTEHGFFLNGVKTKLKGVCVHQGHACVGSAEYDGLHEFKIKKLKEMGCNAYRTAHHPVSRELLDACDRLGMLVMEETRLMSTGNEDRAIFEEMIRNDRNHPSVIMWSIGNEEHMIQFTEQANYICRTMSAIAHKLDPTRPVTEALLMWDMEKKELIRDTQLAAPVADNVDIIGVNYCYDTWDSLHTAYPNKPFVVTESATVNTTRGAVVRSDALCRIALGHNIATGVHAWRCTAQKDYCIGMFAWTGFDYFGEPTPFTYPAIMSSFGIMDVCGFPKYPYYYYKANWRDDIDTFELCPHWNQVDGGERRTMYLFSKCDEAELFVNGASVGRKKIDKYSYASWEVDFEPGEVSAVGYKNGIEAGRKTLATTGDTARLFAKVEHVSRDKNGIVRAIIKLSALDSEGRVVPTADNDFDIITGDGVTLAGAGNGNPICHDNPQSTSYPLFAGLAQVILQRDEADGIGKAIFSIKGMNSVAVEF